MRISIIFVKENLKINIWKEKISLSRDHCHCKGEYRGAAHSICNLKYCAPKKIVIAFHNGFNYDYHFIKKELVDKFKKQFI